MGRKEILSLLHEGETIQERMKISEKGNPWSHSLHAD